MGRLTLSSNYLNAPVKKAAIKKERPAGVDTNALWTRRISRALAWRRNHWNGDSNWKIAYNAYRGKQWNDADENNNLASDSPNDRITVNVTGSSILNLIPFLYNRKVQFIGEGKRPETEEQAKMVATLVNQSFETGRFQDELKDVIYDAAICGHGIAKTGYTLELSSAFNQEDGELEYRDFVKADSPYAKRISPFLFLFDPTSRTCDLRGARWCAEIFFVPFSDLLVDSQYDKKVLKKIESGVYEISKYADVFPQDVNADGGGLSNYLKKGDTDYDVPEDELVVCYEIWDKKFRKVFVFADGCEEPLSEKNWPYEYLNEFPFVRLEFIPVPDCHYPLGIPYMIQDQQYELNRIRTSMFQHRRRFNRKYEVADNVDEHESNKLSDGPDGTIIKVPMIGSIQPIADAPINQDQMITEQYIKQDVQELTGIDSLMRGGALPSRTTGSEVNTRTSLFRLKLDDRVDDVDGFIHAVGVQVMKHIQNNYFVERVVQLLGEKGKYWATVTAEDIKQEVDIRMESVAAPKRDPQMETQQALQLLQISQQMLPLVQQGLIKLNMEELMKWVLEKMDVRDAGRFFNAALIPNAPLQQIPISNNLNVPPVENVAGLPQVGQGGQVPEDLSRESGLPSTLNAFGLQ